MASEAVIRSLDIRRRAVPNDLYAALPPALNPVLRRVYAARNVQAGEIDTGLAGLLPVSSLGGLAEAVGLLLDVRRAGGAVMVVGDYDADGATASALLVATLRRFGFPQVDYLVPNRFEYGYGLSVAVAELAGQSRPALLVTVDNGVSSHAGVARARELGMRVLVTDHHLPGPTLPAADAIVNPNLDGEAFASKALCGVGVVFYLLAALARALDGQGLQPYAQARPVLAEGLDIVALGTIADLVPLDHNNRILVSEGLRRIREGRARPGIEALFRVAGRATAAARSADLGFAVAPRLNAAGRLTDMSLGIACLLASDAGEARALAARLDALNVERQALQARMLAEAESHLQLADAVATGADQAAHCLFDPGWHEGVVGLVAARIKERTGRPAIAFARAEEPGMLKGSARSINGVHIRDALALVAARGQAPGMQFGGHAMAAGVRLPAASLEGFRQALDAAVAMQLALLEPDRVLWTDGPLEPGDLTLELAEQIQFAAPWGQAFPEPLFQNDFVVLERSVLRDRHLRLLLRHAAGDEPVEGIAFNETRQLGETAGVVYRLGINDYGGRRRRQLVVEHIQSD